MIVIVVLLVLSSGGAGCGDCLIIIFIKLFFYLGEGHTVPSLSVPDFSGCIIGGKSWRVEGGDGYIKGWYTSVDSFLPSILSVPHSIPSRKKKKRYDTWRFKKRIGCLKFFSS